VPGVGAAAEVKWIANYDATFKGPIPARQALAESRNAVAVWIAESVGMERVIRTCRDLGFRTPLRPYLSTALGASEVQLLELAGAYRAMASGVRAEPHVIARVIDATGGLLYEPPGPAGEIQSRGLTLIQEGLRGVVRLPGGTAHALSGSAFPIPVMGKTGTTSEFRDALFVGSTYGPQGITVAVRIGFDDNRTLGPRETGGGTGLPVFREIMARVYKDALVGEVPQFPRAMEDRIDAVQKLLASVASLPGNSEQIRTRLTDLGAKIDGEGQVEVDGNLRTTVTGLYAAGCVTPANCQMVIAAGQGATAAQAINRDLFEESLAKHALWR
jgi:membrane carboxypeptidase/penicillin-binding protein